MDGRRRGRDGWVGLGIVAGCLIAFVPLAFAAPSHGIAIFGDLKYVSDFKHFDYVNPDAPKGGDLITMGTGGRLTFDSFNEFVVKGNPAQQLALIYDTLMVRAFDEPDAIYGLVAKTADIAADKMSVTFEMRAEAQFSDGTPLTAADAVFTFDNLKEKGDPRYQAALQDVVKAEAIGPLTLKYSFKGTQVRDLPQTVATLPIVEKAWYANHKFDDTTLDVPIGSGPYKIGKFSQGSFVTYDRRPDYWAKDLPVNVGRYNFDRVRLEYYKDRVAQHEAIVSGVLNFREEFSSKDWATGYDVAPIRDGRMLKETLPDESPNGTQGFFMNMRRDKFKDPRVRTAFDYAFDFEWTQKNIFYGQYTRVASYFENSNMVATGKPSPEELALLEPWRGKIPDEAFGDVYVPPVSDGSGRDRALIRKAIQLFADAGYVVKDGVLTGPDGKPFTLEFLVDDPAYDRYIAPYFKNLKALGIDATLRVVDDSQYELRQKTFDFDMISIRLTGGPTPGTDLRDVFASKFATQEGSYNLAGIASPAVDDLVEKVVAAKSRAELITAAKALDRVLRAGHFWVSNWYGNTFRLAYWNVFSKPAIKPKYDRGVIDTWWYDSVKAAKVKN